MVYEVFIDSNVNKLNVAQSLNRLRLQTLKDCHSLLVSEAPELFPSVPKLKADFVRHFENIYSDNEFYLTAVEVFFRISSPGEIDSFQETPQCDEPEESAVSTLDAEGIFY